MYSAKSKAIVCRVCYKKTDSRVNLSALSEIFSRQKYPCILGGNNAKTKADRFSYWTAEPKEIFEFRAGGHDPFGKLQSALDKYHLEDGDSNDMPEEILRGGWAGYFGYELGRYIERLNETTADDLQMPLIRLCFYDKVICYDHLENNFWLIALDLSSGSESGQKKIADLEDLLKQALAITVRPCGAEEIEQVDFSGIGCNMDMDYYLRSIEKIKRYIYDGEVYQVNFSQRFELDYKAGAIELYHWQNLYNPSGYAAYIDAGEYKIVSTSPEMFINISDGLISTKPIKGTRPRKSQTGESRQENVRNFNELLQSEKERAELNMIIDLERNDLTKVCEYGSIKVIQPRTIESYPTVFHAVATVQGQLRRDISFCDILKAMFPGGSITGAPKVSSMQIIEETEPTSRGVYTGSIGFIGLDGRVCLNIAIRTIIIKADKAFVQTGGGIVADSDPQAEWQETITKARALVAGIKAVQQNTGSLADRK